jgi:hypothetical protein
MKRLVIRLLIMLCLSAMILAGGACKKPKEDANAGPQDDGPMRGQGMGGRPGASPLRDLMMKLAKGPQSLNSLIGGELKSESPPWDTIQKQTKEFLQLASSMGKYDPPKGSKESWTKHTSSFVASADALEKAGLSKNKDKALEAHATLGQSCMSCHREHRGGPGGGGPGGFGPPGGGRPGGGPPG